MGFSRLEPPKVSRLPKIKSPIRPLIFYITNLLRGVLVNTIMLW